MPPRWLCVVIVGCWLAVAGWLFSQEIWPYLQPSQPPPFAIDLLDEFKDRERVNTLWSVKQNGTKVFTGRTHIEHPSPEVFELCAEFVLPPKAPRPVISGVAVGKMTSRYRIDPDGRLQGLTVSIAGAPESKFLNLFFKEKPDFTLRIHGDVRERVFRPVLEVPELGQDYPLPTVEVPGGAGLLQPLHPLQRMRGLRPGQQWQMPVFDPLADSLRTLQGSPGGIRILIARVRPEVELFSHGFRHDVRCLVVDYIGDEQPVSLWVDEHTGQVLRQEATVAGNHWVMDRD
jgi:hypothetical protein